MKDPKRLYTVSDANLVTKVSEIAGYMRRDEAEFAVFKILLSDIQTLEASNAAFQNFPTDEELLSHQKTATAEKESNAVALRQAIRKVMAHVALIHLPASAQYKRFGTASLSRVSDSELLVLAHRVIRAGNDFVAANPETGLKEEALVEIKTLRNAMENGMLESGFRMTDRDIATQDRVMAGNAIYQMLSRFADTGRVIWEDKNVARYNDYLLNV